MVSKLKIFDWRVNTLIIIAIKFSDAGVDVQRLQYSKIELKPYVYVGFIYIHSFSFFCSIFMKIKFYPPRFSNGNAFPVKFSQIVKNAVRNVISHTLINLK